LIECRIKHDLRKPNLNSANPRKQRFCHHFQAKEAKVNETSKNQDLKQKHVVFGFFGCDSVYYNNISSYSSTTGLSVRSFLLSCLGFSFNLLLCKNKTKTKQSEKQENLNKHLSNNDTPETPTSKSLLT